MSRARPAAETGRRHDRISIPAARRVLVLELAVFTDDIDQDLTHALDVAEELGTRWVEVRSA